MIKFAMTPSTLGDIGRAKEMATIAREAGQLCESQYKALSGDQSPSFGAILKVISALGFKTSARAKGVAVLYEIVCCCL
jgi:probable addiction module antidote protein